MCSERPNWNVLFLLERTLRLAASDTGNISKGRAVALLIMGCSGYWLSPLPCSQLTDSDNILLDNKQPRPLLQVELLILLLLLSWSENEAEWRKYSSRLILTIQFEKVNRKGFDSRCAVTLLVTIPQYSGFLALLTCHGLGSKGFLRF